MTHLSLFTGIGGLDLAAEMAGIKTVGQCEWADYPTKVLEKHWPDVPRWRDIRTLTGENFYERTGLRSVDVVSGGFPCQPFSVAGKRRGEEDDRYLWPEMLRVIQELRPAWVVGENVAGIVNMALDTVLSDMEALGYTTQALIIPACSVGASHRRDRCAILSYSNCGGQLYREPEEHTTETGEHAQRELMRRGEDVADSESYRLQGERTRGKQIGGARYEEREFERDRNVCGSSGFRTTQPGLGGVVDGIPAWMDGYWLTEPDIPRVSPPAEHRVDRLRCLGNAVYWPQFYPIFKAIARLEELSNGKG